MIAAFHGAACFCDKMNMAHSQREHDFYQMQKYIQIQKWWCDFRRLRKYTQAKKYYQRTDITTVDICKISYGRINKKTI